MDQKIVGIVGAIAGLASLDAAHGAALAAPSPEGLTGAKSFAELLDPIPNALAMLQAADASRGQNEATQTDVQVAQYHHHHHHHRYHHHHHHHHLMIRVVPRRYHHHHHHHHQHHHNY